MTHRKQSSLAQAVFDETGVDVGLCYQCGKCTAGCPMAPYMDLTPNQVMRLVQVGDSTAADKVLGCTAIWSCAGCLTCTQRCPQELDPAAVMDALREMSYQQGKVSPEQKKVLAFHEAFLKTVEKAGRMSEFALVRRYKTATRDLLSDVTVAPAMMAKGKLKLTGHKIAGRKEVHRIFRACRKRGDR